MTQHIWQSEEKLVDSLERTLQIEQSESSTRQARIIREFDPGVGRVDILCIWFDRQRLQERRLNQQRVPLPFTRLAAYIMTHINTDTWTDIPSLCHTFRMPNAKIRKAIDVLASRELIEQQTNTLRGNENTSLYLIDAIDAYEAKLRRWRDAVQQAYLHQWFASSRYVVMPELSIRVQANLLQTCTVSDIGIMLYHDEYHRTIPFAPLPRVVPKTHVGWYLNELVFDEECQHAARNSST